MEEMKYSYLSFYHIIYRSKVNLMVNIFSIDNIAFQQKEIVILILKIYFCISFNSPLLNSKAATILVGDIILLTQLLGYGVCGSVNIRQE